MTGKLILNKRKWLMRLACACLFFSFQLSFFNSAQAQTQWHTLDEAANAKIGSKFYFVDFYTDWCGYCKKMDRDTFSDPTVAKILNKYFYPVKFNAESTKKIVWFGQTYKGVGGRGRAHEFARGIQGYPTAALYRADGTPFQSIPGYIPAKEFIVIFWYFASGDYERYPYDRYAKIFDKEIRPVMEKELKTK